MEMRQHVPIVAYYCKLYAIQKGNEIVKNDTSGQDTSKIKAFLLNELTDLEAMKKKICQKVPKRQSTDL